MKRDSHGFPIKPRGWDNYTPAASRRSNRWATSARGWLWDGESESSLGNYLDYGPQHYRSPHQYCAPGRCDCRESQPGDIHCIVYARAGYPLRSRYVETVEQAREWIEQQSQFYAAVRMAA